MSDSIHTRFELAASLVDAADSLRACADCLRAGRRVPARTRQLADSIPRMLRDAEHLPAVVDTDVADDAESPLYARMRQSRYGAVAVRYPGHSIRVEYADDAEALRELIRAHRDRNPVSFVIGFHRDGQFRTVSI